MNLAQKSYVDLFGKLPEYRFKITYSGRFSPYNAKVTMGHGLIHFFLSRKWEAVDETIQMGLLQFLLLKLFKSKKNTDALDLYHRFIKTLDKYDGGSSEDAALLASFTRVNDSFFNGLMNMPHLQWGGPTTRQLGVYNFHSNTLRISSIFQGYDDLLDYVMYHELLHKDMKYEHKDTGHRYHTTEFRRRERLFSDEDYEKKLEKFLRRKPWL